MAERSGERKVMEIILAIAQCICACFIWVVIVYLVTKFNNCMNKYLGEGE